MYAYVYAEDPRYIQVCRTLYVYACASDSDFIWRFNAAVFGWKLTDEIYAYCCPLQWRYAWVGEPSCKTFVDYNLSNCWLEQYANRYPLMQRLLAWVYACKSRNTYEDCSNACVSFAVKMACSCCISLVITFVSPDVNSLRVGKFIK